MIVKGTVVTVGDSRQKSWIAHGMGVVKNTAENLKAGMPLREAVAAAVAALEMIAMHPWEETRRSDGCGKPLGRAGAAKEDEQILVLPPGDGVYMEAFLGRGVFLQVGLGSRTVRFLWWKLRRRKRGSGVMWRMVGDCLGG